MTFLTEYSLWFALICILIGASYSFLLYYKNRNIVFESRAKRTMFIFRGITVALIAFLLLAPMLRLTIKKTEKPIIIVGVDNTESIILTPDSNFYATTFKTNYKDLIRQLQKNYEVVNYALGGSVHLIHDNTTLDFSEKSTNLAALFEEINDYYTNRNIGAVILLTDGIFNEGSNPLYLAEKQKAPVYTVGMGNPEAQPDLYISNIVYNRQTFLGNLFPVEIKVAATQLAGKNTTLTVSDGNKDIFTKNINIAGNQFFENVRFTLTAKEKGVHRYQVNLTPVENEISIKNNSASFYIEVIDQREKIAIIYHSPHPDISAIKSALETSDRYQIDLFSTDKLPANIDNYVLFILHQLPSNHQVANNLVAKIQTAGNACWYILGESSNLQTFNGLNLGLNISQNKKLRNEAMPAFNDNFVSFTFSDEAKKMLAKLPPVSTPFGEYKSVVSSNTFLYQKINGITTNYPLFIFNDNNAARTGILTGTGIWQWKLYNYLYANNHDVFNEIINKTTFYLSTKGDKSFFRVMVKNVYNENAPVDITAELYNESYELQNDPEVQFQYIGKDGKKHEMQFSKQNNAYFLSLGKLPAGTYSWSANVKFGDKSYSKSGVFTVQEIDLETLSLVANHSLLQNIAESTHGKFYTADDFSSLENDIRKNENIKTIASYQKRYSLFLNSWWYFIAIILLFGAEWFMRKWGGGY
ncbi:MAG: VWA domain-containing protein [Bacteroidetes bacterium]|nr:VWA domain-containing protein [Bacteroidota bacterium]MCL2302805.1 VWA domain-containing protein [Lentimicrobiaceae bacterium]